MLCGSITAPWQILAPPQSSCALSPWLSWPGLFAQAAIKIHRGGFTQSPTLPDKNNLKPKSSIYIPNAQLIYGDCWFYLYQYHTIIESLSWKRPSRSLNPTIIPELPSPPLICVPKHHIYKPFKSLQRWILILESKKHATLNLFEDMDVFIGFLWGGFLQETLVGASSLGSAFLQE